MFRNSLLALLLMMPTLPALANQADGSIFSQAQSAFKLAQISQDELRERWEQSSPEERIRLRRYIQERVRQLPTPAQEAIGLPFPGVSPRDRGRDREPNRNPNDNAGAENPNSRFGFGFERRNFEDSVPEVPVWPGQRRSRDDNRR